MKPVSTSPECQLPKSWVSLSLPAMPPAANSYPADIQETVVESDDWIHAFLLASLSCREWERRLLTNSFARTMPTFYGNTLEADNKFALVLIQPEVSSFNRCTEYLFYHIIFWGRWSWLSLSLWFLFTFHWSFSFSPFPSLECWSSARCLFWDLCLFCLFRQQQYGLHLTNPHTHDLHQHQHQHSSEPSLPLHPTRAHRVEKQAQSMLAFP